MSRRCENCSAWSSTDRVWGDCTVIRSENSFRPSIERAYVNEEGSRPQAELWTKYNFGCVEWASLKAVVASIAAAPGSEG